MSDERLAWAAIIPALLFLLLTVGIAVWFWWPQVQDAVAFWGWPTW